MSYETHAIRSDRSDADEGNAVFTRLEKEMVSLDPPHFDLKMELAGDSGMTDTAHRNRELLVLAYDAMVSGSDPQALMHLLHPEVRFYEAQSLPYGCMEIGPDGCMRGVQKMFAAWSSLRVTFTEFAAAGDIVIAYMRLTGTAISTGKVYDQPGWEMFRFREGKIIEWRPIYWDVHEIREVCGLS